MPPATALPHATTSTSYIVLAASVLAIGTCRCSISSLLLRGASNVEQAMAGAIIISIALYVEQKAAVAARKVEVVNI